jgi:SAM-dependent methyltransferase
MTAEEIRSGLALLEPGIPWAHHFDLGHNIETIDASNEKYFKKAVGLRKLADLILKLIPYHTRKGSVEGLRVLDLACGEGCHSISMSEHGAEVLGIDGRQLYVKRATFAASAMGRANVRFSQGDVRAITQSDVGQFDLVLFLGILHHLAPEDFEGIIDNLHTLCRDTLILYTHVSNEASIKRFRLTGPHSTPGGLEGYLFREHEDGASDKQKEDKVRASLDNTFSFWATELSLVTQLQKSGFSTASRLLLPHIFGYENAQMRHIIIARK